MKQKQVEVNEISVNLKGVGKPTLIPLSFENIMSLVGKYRTIAVSCPINPDEPYLYVWADPKRGSGD